MIHTHPGIQSSIILQTIPSPTCGIPRNQNSYWGPSTTISIVDFLHFRGPGQIYDIFGIILPAWVGRWGVGEWFLSFVKSSQARTGCRVAHRVTLPGSQCLGRNKRWKIWGTHHLPSWFHTFPHFFWGVLWIIDVVIQNWDFLDMIIIIES